MGKCIIISCAVSLFCSRQWADTLFYHHSAWVCLTSTMSLHLKCNPACFGLRCLFDLLLLSSIFLQAYTHSLFNCLAVNFKHLQARRHSEVSHRTRSLCLFMQGNVDGPCSGDTLRLREKSLLLCDLRFKEKQIHRSHPCSSGWVHGISLRPTSRVLFR